MHNCLALICTLSRASQAPGSPSTSKVTESKQKSEGDTATADAATGGGAGTGGASADAGAGAAQQLSRELTDLTLVFLDVLPTFLVWLQGAPAICWAEAQNEDNFRPSKGSGSGSGSDSGSADGDGANLTSLVSPVHG